MRIIPCIDIYEGKVVRLTKGNYAKITFYSENPVDQAKVYWDNGIEYVHLVDLSAAKTGVFTQQHTVRQIVRQTKLKIDVGGGIRNLDIVLELLNIGVEYVNIGTLAVLSPDSIFEWSERIGTSKIVPSFDIHNNKICIGGWQKQLDMHPFDLIQLYISHGIRRFSVTDVTRDGTLKGINLQLFSEIKKQFRDIEIIAGGGVSSVRDLYLLSEINLFGVVIGKAIFENKVTLNQLKTLSDALQKNNTMP